MTDQNIVAGVVEPGSGTEGIGAEVWKFEGGSELLD
jgi:hypothetical protein